MALGRRCGTVLLTVGLVAGAARAAASKEELTARLWPAERIRKALEQVERLRSAGLMSPAHYQRKKAMLQQRRAGRFVPSMLSTSNPPLNFIQNAGFEEINRNSAPNRSRWLWWGGWSWGGDYENRWEDRPAYVRAGRYSARIRCTGKPGRIGISTPKLPIVPGAKEYLFTIWGKGEGDNRLFVNFEAGTRGTLIQKVPPQWTLITVKGTPDPGATSYMLYIYATGRGTIWLDDARLVPVGGALDD